MNQNEEEKNECNRKPICKQVNTTRKKRMKKEEQKEEEEGEKHKNNRIILETAPARAYEDEKVFRVCFGFFGE